MKGLQDAILFKDEGGGGPVWVRRNGKVSNYQDSEHRDWNGKPVPAWFSRRQAVSIAKKERLPFEEA